MATSGIMQRMSGRERRFVGLLVVMALVGGCAFGYIYLGKQIEEVEETLEDGQTSIEEIRVRARDYLDSMRRKKALENAIKDNDPKIQTAIDSIAKKVDVTKLSGAESEETTFDKVLRYEAKTTERSIHLGEKAKKKSKASDFIELSQPMEFTFVKFIDFIRFLEQVESPERLMYVAKLKMTKKYMDPEYINGTVTIATFIYRPQDTDEEDED